jgi:hypothetical protein
MRYLTLTFTAYVLLVLLGPMWRLMPFDVIVPNLTVVFAVYLGVTARESLAAPTATAVTIGYLADLLGGSPAGLMAFIGGLACVVSRALTVRLLVRGRGFIMSLGAAVTLGAALLTLGLRGWYGAHVGGLADEAVVAIGCALLTGAVSAPVFRLCRSLDARFARTEREREAVREGYLN